MTRTGHRTRRTCALIAGPLGALAMFLSSGCVKKKIPPPPPAAPQIGWTEDGIASWYGYPYHGRRAANGEVYDMESLTAAHRTLPFGAVVRVWNLDSGRDVTVRIIDRGPFVEGRIIDLSRAAARSIRMIGPGTARVRIQLLAYGPARMESAVGGGPANGGEFAVQVGAFVDRNRAENLRRTLERTYHPVAIIPREAEKIQWRVLVGRKPSEDEARLLADELRARLGAAFVVRLDP